MRIREFVLSDVSMGHTCTKCGLVLILKIGAEISQTTCPSCGAESLNELRDVMTTWNKLSDTTKSLPLKFRLPRAKGAKAL